MSAVASFGNLIPVRSVVERWTEVAAENVERWREIVIRNYEAQYATQLSIGKKDKLSLLLSSLKDLDFSTAEEPPEFEFFTGISFTERQKTDFENGRTRSVQSMARNFLSDVFGGLIDPVSFVTYTSPVKAHSTHVATRRWHRDPARVVLFATDALPMSLLRGAMDSNLPQRHSDFATIGACGDENIITKINDWAQKEGRLVTMPIHALIIDVGRSWHCPALNASEEPVRRTFLRGTAHITVEPLPE